MNTLLLIALMHTPPFCGCFPDYKFMPEPKSGFIEAGDEKHVPLFQSNIEGHEGEGDGSPHGVMFINSWLKCKHGTFFY